MNLVFQVCGQCKFNTDVLKPQCPYSPFEFSSPFRWVQFGKLSSNTDCFFMKESTWGGFKCKLVWMFRRISFWYSVFLTLHKPKYAITEVLGTRYNYFYPWSTSTYYHTSCHKETNCCQRERKECPVYTCFWHEQSKIFTNHWQTMFKHSFLRPGPLPHHNLGSCTGQV